MRVGDRGDDMQQRAAGQNQAHGRCRIDMTFVHGVPTLLGELLDSPIHGTSNPKWALGEL